MNPAIPSTHPCPDLEELAAFVDGRLAGHACAAVVAHLASCEDCYEVYAETLRVGEDLEAAPAAVNDEAAAGELAPVVRHPRSFRWPWPAAAAALAAAAAVVLVLRLPDFLSTSRSSGELVAAAGIGAKTRLGDDWGEQDWSRTRGDTSFYELLSPEERSFRVGVRVVDLRSALALDDRDIARRMAAEIAQLLEAEELGFQQIYYETLDEEFEGGTPTENLIEMSAQAEKSYMPENATYFELGKWVEAARLAALAGNVRYFENRALRRFLKSLPKEELPEDLARLIGEFEAAVQVEPTPEALKVVKETLEKIIDVRKRPA